MIVARVPSVILVAALPGILDAGGHAALGTCPGVDRLAIAIAHVIQENGRTAAGAAGQLKASFCNAVANIDSTPGERADPARKLWHSGAECEGTACQWHAEHWRCAFDSAEDGAEYFWRAIATRWPDAFYALDQGPRAYTEALHAGKYFTGSLPDYIRSMELLTIEAHGFIADLHPVSVS